MDRDIQEAIEGVLSSIVEQVLWRLTDDELNRDHVMDWITECDGNEAAAIGLTLGQKLEAIEEGAEACDLGDLSFDLSDLRSSLESYAVLSIHRLAESQASTMFDELFRFETVVFHEVEQLVEHRRRLALGQPVDRQDGVRFERGSKVAQ
ncbi:MAG: hypothetical protein AAGE94_22815, partial [Acidobacteriota bacterium]